ncbi:MAG TPA: FkbM family methyltransferase [Burkholderiales bacterium]|nr:FkbM family methyltransferase [Burkholderiales bacterium]
MSLPGNYEMQPTAARPVTDAIYWLWAAGVRFGAAIDVGCADGWFLLELAELGPLRGKPVLNIDAQEDYRDSLAAIQQGIGGHFRICAASDRDGGEMELQVAVHPYWSSIRPPGDRYWESMHDLRASAARVPLRTLDALAEETALPGPYLLKLDVQGAEIEALRGAPRVLAQTSVLAVESAVEDFQPVHELVSAAGFDLFDLCHLCYRDSGALGWFYPIYVSRRHRGLADAKIWEAGRTGEVIAMQKQHREATRDLLGQSLARLRAGAWRPIVA